MGIYCLQMGAAILTRVGLLYLTTQSMGDELGSVADAKHGQTTYELAQVNLESLGVVHRIGRTAQDDTDDRGVVLGELVVRQYLAEGVELTYTAADKLRGL